MEALLILSAPEQVGLRSTIERRVQIVQEASPKVIVVSGDPTEIQRLSALPEITTADQLAAREGVEAATHLTSTEQLFVDAWLQRRMTSDTKERVGEGLNWGAKGFEAP